MQLGASLVQYAVVGTLFWLGLLGAAAVISPSVLTAGGSALASVDVPPSFGNTFNGLSSALGVAVVFATGLLLDLAGTFWFRREGDWLLEESLTHEAWLAGFLKRHDRFLGKDVEVLLAQLGRQPDKFAPVSWRRRTKAVKAEDAAMQARIDARGRASTRCVSLLLATATGNADLRTQVELWRTRRAVAMAFFALGLACGLMFIVTLVLEFWGEVATRPLSSPPPPQSFITLGGRAVLSLAIGLPLMEVSRRLTERAFRDLAVWLFAYGYISDLQREGMPD